MKTLKDLFRHELADIYDAERRVLKALLKMAKAATCPELRAAFASHLKETERQVKRLDQVFQAVGTRAKGRTCEATVGLLKEADELATAFQRSPALNAALIAAAQKVEHYEIASYGCLHEWAEQLGNEKAAGLLKQTLDEEKHANEALNALAHTSLNQKALGLAGRNGAPDEHEAEPSPGPRLQRSRGAGSGLKRTGPLLRSRRQTLSFRRSAPEWDTGTHLNSGSTKKDTTA